jgi:dTDP-4-amino-4,6-dideoxygalactose transaminase
MEADLRNLPGWPIFADEEIMAVERVLRSGKVNYWTGEEGRSFEKEFAAYFEAKFSVLLSNGTLALELPLRAWGVGPGDEVVVSPRSFVASASVPMLVGAKPVFADIDPDSGNLTAETIAAAVTGATKAVIVVHIGGWPADMPAIMGLCRARGIKVIEDCAQAHGARRLGRPVGTFGDAASWSFCQDKIITTAGEGGMVTTDDESLWESMWSFKDHGKSYDAVYRRTHGPGFRWLHEGLGTNGRMTEVQAAVGRLALQKLPEWTATRNRNAAILIGHLGNLAALRVPRPPAECEHAYYKFTCYVREDGLQDGWNRDRLLELLHEEGMPAFSGSCSEIYREEVFARAGLGPVEPLRVARDLGLTSLTFLVHPTLTEAHMDAYGRRIAETVRSVSR